MQIGKIRDLVLLCLAGFIILLNGCSSTSTPDGPPKFYVDETKIPNAVPKPEPLAKYGNIPSYRVFGKRYYTLNSNKNYDEVGVASWYGTKFNARRTSSGEPYNMLAMTAAHKTLPLPTYVEVTNLKNRRKIIVKVNDRGPFSQNRIIDLSYVAAKKLGMIGHGTTRVRVRAIDPYSYGKPTMVARNTPRRYLQPSKTHKVYLQVGVFRSRSNAVKLRQRLVALLRTPVNLIMPNLTSGYYKVNIGPIEDVATADSLTERLQGLGFKPNKLGY